MKIRKSPKLWASLLTNTILLLCLSSCGHGNPKPQPGDPPGLNEYSNVGLGYYGILSDSWPCEASYSALKDYGHIRIAFVWNTFGKNLSCLNKFLADSRISAIEIHLINEVCQRNGNCGTREFLKNISVSDYAKKLKAKDPKLLSSIRGYAQDAANLVLPNIRPGTICYISPGLESNLDSKAGKILIDTISPIFPGCGIVWGGSGIIPNTLKEGHGANPNLSAPCIADLDGQDISLPSRVSGSSNKIPYQEIPAYLDRLKHCDLNFLWVTEFNGRHPSRWEDPLKRTNWPNQTILNDVAELGKVH